LSRAHFFGTVGDMAECGDRAVLLVTTTPAGTATHLVRRRVDLRCGLEANHEGAHRDSEHGEGWERSTGRSPTIVRHEDDDVEP
jgi:hypothetical protein